MRNQMPSSMRAPMRRMAMVCGLFVAGFLTACSGGNEVPTLELEMVRAGGNLIRSKIAARSAPARPPLTRAGLDTVEGSFLEVILERRDQLAYLHVNTVRRDSGPGQITVWRTEDNITLSMRNGVLIATRGLGGDIISSLVQVSGKAPGPASGGERVHYIRALDNKELRLSLICTLEDMGPETVVIVELAHPARHLRETCTGGTAAGEAGTVVNDYWVDSRNQMVWQSRQWAGPYIGYLRTRRLTN